MSREELRNHLQAQEVLVDPILVDDGDDDRLDSAKDLMVTDDEEILLEKVEVATSYEGRKRRLESDHEPNHYNDAFQGTSETITAKHSSDLWPFRNRQSDGG